MLLFRSVLIGLLAVVAACNPATAQAPRPPNHLPVTIGARAAAAAATGYRDTLRVGDSALVAANAANGAAPAGHVYTKTRLQVYVGDTVVVVGAAGTVAPPPPSPPPPPPSGTWNMPAGMTIVCQTGAITPRSAGLSNVQGTASTAGTYNFGGPVPCAWIRNGGDGSIGLSSAATNPDGTANTDVQASGYRVMFPAGRGNDAAWDAYFRHASGTGTYYIGWRQRWQPRGSYAALLAALNSADSKAWAPKGPSPGDLTIMSWLAANHPIIGLNFQGVDGHNIPDNNGTGASGTIPVTGAMTLPGVAAGNGAWDQEEVLITSTGPQAASSVCFFVNGAKVGCATGVTNAMAWTATEQYLSRSIYKGTEAQTTYTDLDQVTIAVR